MNGASSPLAGRAIYLLAAVSLAAGLLFEWAARRHASTTTESQDAEIRAVERMTDARVVLAAARAKRIDAPTARELARVDPADTGLVGIEWSSLVTTPGTLDAKQASTDPRWAGLLVRWMREAGVGPGTRVAIGASGSFPALAFAAQIAAESLGAEPIVAGSLGASNFGATIPTFDLHDMHRTLLDAGVLHTPMRLLSPGGDEDRLAGLDEEREWVAARLATIAAQPDAPEILMPASRLESIARREEVFFGPNGVGSDPSVVLFVTVGGHAANYGVGPSALALPNGLIPAAQASTLFPPTAAHIGDSVAIRALRNGVPVVNLLGIRDLMVRHGMGYHGGAVHSQHAATIPAGPLSGPWRIAAALLGVTLLAAVLGSRPLRGRHEDSEPEQST
ncbi:MAG: poly-gamma-glutamate system protein [Candidatus Sumerlaeia bacterium]|nr:poly-gamma-glutamate system protein [Candidatus Sumerlaeia bacterium]